MEFTTPTFWKKCNSCKKEIGFSTQYYVCSVSACQHKRKGVRFCSVPCWDAHLGMMNHRDAWAEERTSPSQSEVVRALANEAPTRAPVRKVVTSAPNYSVSSSTAGDSSTFRSGTSGKDITTDTLVVVSKVKKLIKEQSGYNTSNCAVEALTKKVVEECLKGIEFATKAERKTVMGRDIRRP